MIIIAKNNLQIDILIESLGLSLVVGQNIDLISFFDVSVLNNNAELHALILSEDITINDGILDLSIEDALLHISLRSAYEIKNASVDLSEVNRTALLNLWENGKEKIVSTICIFDVAWNLINTQFSVRLYRQSQSKIVPGVLPFEVSESILDGGLPTERKILKVEVISFGTILNDQVLVTCYHNFSIF